MQTVQSEAFDVAGLSAVVSNAAPDGIAARWEAFRKSDLAAAVAGRASDDLYCVYHAYQGGAFDPYTMTIGYRLPPGGACPAGLSRAHVPAQRLAVFEVTGPQPGALVTQWQAIWQGDLPRRFDADFDRYPAEDPARVFVHVGVTG